MRELIAPKSEDQTSPRRRQKLRSWAILITTNLLAIACLVWVLKDLQFTELLEDVKEMDWRWVLVALVSDVCVYMFHAVRWRLLLWPVQEIPFGKTIQSIYVGLFANEVLPLRAGELIRCFLLSKTTELPVSVSFASALIERIFDGIWLMVCFFFTLRMGQLPGVLLKGGYIVGAIVVGLAIVLAAGMYARKQAIDNVLGFKWPPWFNTLIDDLHQIGHSRYLYFSFLVSGLYMGAQLIPIYCVVRAADLDVTWNASFTMLVLLRLSSIVPQAPGNLGSFQWVTAKTLMMFGMESAISKRFSLILWGVVTLPLLVIGAIALALEGLNLTHLHREAAASARGRRADTLARPQVET